MVSESDSGGSEGEVEGRECSAGGLGASEGEVEGRECSGGGGVLSTLSSGLECRTSLFSFSTLDVGRNPMLASCSRINSTAAAVSRFLSRVRNRSLSCGNC